MRKLTSLCAVFVAILGGTVNAQFLLNPYQFACPALTANTAVFDGSNDYITKGSAFSGLADSKSFTLSFWIDANGGDGSAWHVFSIYNNVTPTFILERVAGGNNLQISALNSSSTLILQASTSQTVTAGSGWQHIYIAIDLSNSSNRHIYFNGTEDGSVTWSTYTDDTIDLSTAVDDAGIGANPQTASFKINAALAEWWFDDAYFNNPTKFRCSAGHPISLGSTGNLPTGSAPVLYLSLNGAGDSWAVDSSGNGNTFAVTGTLGTTTSP